MTQTVKFTDFTDKQAWEAINQYLSENTVPFTLTMLLTWVYNKGLLPPNTYKCADALERVLLLLLKSKQLTTTGKGSKTTYKRAGDGKS